MLTYVLLLCALLVFWLLSFKLSGWELVAPVPLALLGLSISIALAIVGLSTWNHVEMGFEVALVIAVGAASMVVAMALTENRGCFRIARASIGVDGYRAPIWKYAVVGVLLIFAIGLRMHETIELGIQLGASGSSYSEAAAVVRKSLSSIHTADGMRAGIGFSMIERQLEKVVTASGYVVVYLMARAVAKRECRRALPPFALFLLASSFCLVSGSRTAILYYVVAFFVLTSVFLFREHEEKRKSTSIKLLGVGVAIAAIGCLAFYASSTLVGRKASSGLLEYISFYFGCGAPSLQSLIDKGVPAEAIPGVRTFYFLFSLPFKFGLISDFPSYSIAWVDAGGHGSNVFTGFARYYLDFGFAGLVIFSVLGAVLMTYLYRAARETYAPVLMVLAGYMSVYAFDFAREEFVFSRLISPNQFIIIAIMLVITLFLTTSLREDAKRAKAFFSRKRLA